jgi:hypothetical protein
MRGSLSGLKLERRKSGAWTCVAKEWTGVPDAEARGGERGVVGAVDRGARGAAEGGPGKRRQRRAAGDVGGGGKKQGHTWVAVGWLDRSGEGGE